MSVQALSCAMVVRGVSASEKLLLLVLANYADEHMTCWPSHKRMAADTCLTERTILSLLKGLEAKRLISRRERKRGDGSRTTDAITLHFSGEITSPHEETSDAMVGKLTAPGGAEISPLTTFEPSLNHQTKPPPADEPDGFDEWWEAYPRKVAKGSARKAYKAALKKAKPEVLLASLRAHAFSPELRYQPHAATWLNGECWLDSEAATSPSSRPGAADDDPWRGRLLRWRIAKYWNTEWGPKPGKPGYRGPSLEDLAA